MHQLRSLSISHLSPIAYLFGNYRPCSGDDAVRYVAGTSWIGQGRDYANPKMLRDLTLSLSKFGWLVKPGMHTGRQIIQKGMIVIELIGDSGKSTIDANAFGPCFRVGKASRGFLRTPADEFNR
jgi:hypothetical protein